jgi:hypothetical protein
VIDAELIDPKRPRRGWLTKERDSGIVNMVTFTLQPAIVFANGHKALPKRMAWSRIGCWSLIFFN